jgi:hypothetical protein
VCLFRGPRGARKDGEGERHGMGEVDEGWVEGWGGDKRGGDEDEISNEKRKEMRLTLPLLERVVRERTESTLAPSVTIPKVPQRPPRRTQ